MKTYRTIIVDDEPLARDKLRRLIKADDRLVLIAEARNGREAIEQTRQLRPDLIFLDIRMPGLSGLDVVEAVSPGPHIIFTTAYENHAVAAFELQALDYLLKPFGVNRFQRAIDRLDGTESVSGDQLLGLSVGQLTQIFVRMRGRILRIPTSDIIRIKAADNYAEIHTATAKHLVSVRMKELENRLDSGHFIRIHRSTIINLNCILEILNTESGYDDIVLSDGAHEHASRSGAARLRTATEGAIR